MTLLTALHCETPWGYIDLWPFHKLYDQKEEIVYGDPS
jgi:hypothetical protein